MASSQYSPRSSAPCVGVGGDGDPLSIGVDRDSEIVAFDYDEGDEGVKETIRLAVQGCRRNGIHSGLCGQAPSDYPDMAEFLVCVHRVDEQATAPTLRINGGVRHDVGSLERLGPH